ncbi:hypothetical protein HOD61_00165 [archaeon]|jgi:hypothetical protein|nr:hypothetical protein [archaeon]
MIFVQRLIENKPTADDHKQLIRFSKGIFKTRSASKINIVKGLLKVSASYDLAKDIARMIANTSNKISIKGKVIKSKKKEEFDEVVTKERLLALIEENDFFLLHLTAGDYSLKVGKSIPKPGKELKVNWCKAVLPVENAKDFAFDFELKKKAEISHDFVIEDIIVPKEYVDDFQKARMFSKRKGKIIRRIIIDGEETETETEFKA